MAIDMEKLAAFAGSSLQKFTSIQNSVTATGTSDGERVKITINGEYHIKDLYLADELLKERTATEIGKLIITAYNRARNELQENIQEATMDLIKENGLDSDSFTR